ncbi:cohesin domain-containing protein [Herbiconiux sp. 11R-BC]|uniref:cohesin domain-containing protein n=1 Tax=Herbiconiux sp. 11R-BC TaxID=3111637 RepID=UPI003C107BD0
MHESSPRRRRLRSALVAGGLALGLSLVGAAPAFAAGPTAGTVTLYATPTVTVGDSVDVELSLAGTADVFSYEIVVGYDHAALSYVAGSASDGPAGGFTSATDSADGVHLLYTRLGTSPAIGGDIPLTLQFTSLASGAANITVPSVTVVDTTGGTDTLTDAAAFAVVIEALPTPTPTPTPTVTPTAEPTATATSTPAAVASGDSGSLALTGLSIGALVLFAVAALAAGILVVVRRRSASAR